MVPPNGSMDGRTVKTLKYAVSRRELTLSLEGEKFYGKNKFAEVHELSSEMKQPCTYRKVAELVR